MKLNEAIKHEGKPFLVENCSRNELPEFFKELGFKVGAEIGVWEGIFSEKFCKIGMKMYGIDPWIARGTQSQRHQNARAERAMELLKPYGCEIIRKKSMDAVKDFEDESLDFVYIDGDHRYGYVLEDIIEWSKKVRKGGVVAGHDYACTDPEINALPIKYQLHLEVGQAVNKCIEDFGIKNFYIYGRSKPAEDETKNDMMLSWLFFKE